MADEAVGRLVQRPARPGWHRHGVALVRQPEPLPEYGQTPAFELTERSGRTVSSSELAGKVWRIGLMGYSSRIENITRCLGALDGVLADLGAPVNHGVALPAAEKVLAA